MDKTIKAFDYLRFPLILVVILIHCNYFRNVLGLAENVPICFGVIDFLQKNVYSIAVPLFFFISGYLFFRDGIPSLEGYKKKLKRRITTLVVPYLLWNIIGLAIFLLKKTPYLSPYFPQYNEIGLTVATIAEGFIKIPIAEAIGPYNLVLWFVRDLIFVMAITPLIGAVLKRAKWLALPIFIAMTYLNPDYSFVYYNVFFSTGAFCAVNKIKIESLVYRYKYLLFFLWLLAIVITMRVETEVVVHTAELIKLMSGIFIALLLSYKAVNKNFIPKYLSAPTFFLYACHGLYVTAVCKVVLIIVNVQSEISALLVYLLIFAALLGGTYLLFILARRFTPQLLSVLTGNRC